MSKSKKKSKRTAFNAANVQWWTQQECNRIKQRNKSFKGALQSRPTTQQRSVALNPKETEQK